MNIANTFGLKGKGAPAWLATQGLSLPAQPNTRSLSGDNCVLRLGRGEYLIAGPAAASLRAAWQSGPAGDAMLVPRYDAVFTLDNGRQVLTEICALDTRPEVVADGVLMTLAAGISVTLIHDGKDYRLWCDATYGDYMQHVLQEPGISL